MSSDAARRAEGGGAVIALGSVNVDVQVRAARWPEPSETLIVDEFSLLGGGKAANVAVIARRLGPARIRALQRARRRGYHRRRRRLRRRAGLALLEGRSAVEAARRAVAAADATVTGWESQPAYPDRRELERWLGT